MKFKAPRTGGQGQSQSAFLWSHRIDNQPGGLYCIRLSRTQLPFLPSYVVLFISRVSSSLIMGTCH
jgi:hypothetical protein